MKTALIIYGKPVSVNHLYRSGVSRNNKRSRFLTDDGKHWKLAIAASYLEMFGREIHKGYLTVFAEYYFPIDKRRRDVTNYDKAILDALKGLAYEDDNQILNFVAIKQASKTPRTEITIFSDLEKNKDEIVDKFIEVIQKEAHEKIEQENPHILKVKI